MSSTETFDAVLKRWKLNQYVANFEADGWDAVEDWDALVADNGKILETDGLIDKKGHRAKFIRNFKKEFGKDESKDEKENKTEKSENVVTQNGQDKSHGLAVSRNLMYKDDQKESEIPSTEDYEKCLDTVIGDVVGVQVSKWFKTVLDKLWDKLNDTLVILLGGKFKASTIKGISNTIRDLIIGLVATIFSTVFGILCNPCWWKFTIKSCLEAFEAEDSYLKGALAFGKKFVAILLSSLIKVIEQILRINDMTLNQSENDELECLIGRCVDVSTLKLGNQHKPIKNE